MPRRLTEFLIAGSIALFPCQTFAQTSPQSARAPAERAVSALETPSGNELHFDVAGYKYVEPGDTSIAIHGPKFGGGYTGTMALSRERHWFLQTDAHGLFGHTTYDGWCSPYLITPDGRSPNGYALDIGDPSPCSESGDKDWYVEARARVGKDFVGTRWGWSPEIGLGVRHLSNGTGDVPGWRTDDYLYLPLGITARTLVAPNHALGIGLEYDQLLHGWQKTRDSKLGGGDIPATPSAPAFTIEGFSDVSFDQHSGWAIRARAKYQLTGRWSVEPEYIHWSVGDSPPSDRTATFTVNGITAEQQMGFYEPSNYTNEFNVKVGVRF